MSDPIVVVVTLKDTQGFEKIWIDGVCAASGKDLLIKDDVSGDFETSNVKVECFDAVLYAQTKGSCVPLTIKFLSGDKWREIDMNGDSNKFMREEMDSASSTSEKEASEAVDGENTLNQKNKVAYVHVTTDLKESDLEYEDQCVAGVYRIVLSGKTPDEGLANAALDGFHYGVPIGTLEDFSISVRKTEDASSENIESSDAFKNGELIDHLILVDLCEKTNITEKPSAETPR